MWLQNTDRQADNKGDVLLTAQRGCLQWGVWVNTHKNPRFKLIDFGGIGMTVDIPKQLALASVAMRVQVGMCKSRSTAAHHRGAAYRVIETC